MKTEDIKKMALAWKEVQEAAKKKLDPVGKADADIDNDGDTDKSDEYLHNRRKAVSAAIKGKSMKEEEDRSKLDSFLKGMDGNKLHAATKKRSPTQHVMKDKKDVQKEEVEQIDELSKKTLGSYVKKASRNLAGREYKRGAEKDASTSNLQKSYKRDMGIAKAVDKLTKEEVENLDELKKSTLGSYVKKASTNQIGNTAAVLANKNDPETDRARKRIGNRMVGIAKATDKLTKEEAEIEEKKLTPKEIKAALGAAKAKPKDQVSVAKAPWDMKKEDTQRWRVYNKILEADAHLKGATPPEAIDSKASQGEKDFVKLHGGLDGNDSGIDGAKAAADTAKNAAAGVKVAPKRPSDNPAGDKSVIKSTEAK